MAVKTITQLKEWFSRGKYPTGEQFADLIDSFKPRSEKLTIAEVEGLDELLNGGYSRVEGEALERLMEQSLEVVETLRDDYDNIWRQKGAAGGFAPLDDEGKLPDDFLPAGVRGVCWLRAIVSSQEWAGLGMEDRKERWYLIDTQEIKTIEADGTEVTESPESGLIYVDERGRGLYVWTGTELRQLRGESGQQIVDHTESQAMIVPNVLHRWGEVAELTLDFAPQQEGYAGEYCIEFVSGEIPTNLSLPAGVKFPDEPTIEANMRYQISVVNNVGLIAGVEL